jgi:hypothetical protein
LSRNRQSIGFSASPRLGGRLQQWWVDVHFFIRVRALIAFGCHIWLLDHSPTLDVKRRDDETARRLIGETAS